MPKFHIFLLCILYHDYLSLNIFFFFFWQFGWILKCLERWMLGLLVATCLTSLLAHQKFELLSSLTLLQKFVKFFYEVPIQWFIAMNL